MIYDRERQICGTRLRKLEKLWLPGMGQNVSICSGSCARGDADADSDIDLRIDNGTIRDLQMGGLAADL